LPGYSVITLMDTKNLHITELFKQFADAQQAWLRKRNCEMQPPVAGLLEQLLARCQPKSEIAILQQALLDPYCPLGMLEQTIFADVIGMRFFVNKRRPALEALLAEELVAWTTAFLRIRHDIKIFFDPAKVTCIPVDGTRHRLPYDQWCILCGMCCQIGGIPPEPPTRHRLPYDQWCILCGMCCQIGGIPPEPPPSVRYPDHWYPYLAGEAIDNQQLCPFLFQYFGEPRFFCAVHHIKPLACRQFDRKDCRQRLAEGGLHA